MTGWNFEAGQLNGPFGNSCEKWSHGVKSETFLLVLTNFPEIFRTVLSTPVPDMIFATVFATTPRILVNIFLLSFISRQFVQYPSRSN